MTAARLAATVLWLRARPLRERSITCTGHYMPPWSGEVAWTKWVVLFAVVRHTGVEPICWPRTNIYPASGWSETLHPRR